MPRPKKIDTETENTKSQLSKSSFGKNEILWLTYTNENGKHYYITSDQIRNNYYLYEEQEPNVIIKTKHKANTPTDLYRFVEM